MAEDPQHRSLVQSLMAWFRRALSAPAPFQSQQQAARQTRDGVQLGQEDPDRYQRESQAARAREMERAARQARGMAPRQRGRGGMEW